MVKDEKDEEDEDEDDIFQGGFDFSKFLQDPNKVFKSKEFQKIFKAIYKKLSENLPPEFQGLSPEDLLKEFMKNRSKFGAQGPFVAGINLGFDSNGKPKMEPFGNIKPEKDEEVKVDDVRDPLVEVTEEEDKVIVIAEMPGVVKEDIEIKATTRTLTISTKGEGKSSRKYYKEISLPSAINSDVAKARYQNGILEIKLKRIDEEHKNIKID